VEGARRGIIRSAHDCAEGGLAITVAESCFDSGFGAIVDVNAVAAEVEGFEAISTLFSESASRVVVSVGMADVGDLLTLASREGIAATRLGLVGGSAIRIAIDGLAVIDMPVQSAEEIWATAIEQRLEASRAVA
jgi:phosphoribosylformylglycinamidine synthase